MAKSDIRNLRSKKMSVGNDRRQYDDEGRGYSKTIWERFEQSFSNSGCRWLFALDSDYATTLLHRTTWRYGLKDGPSYFSRENETEDRIRDIMLRDDSRVARLVKSKCGDDVWVRFYTHVMDRRDEYIKEREIMVAERDAQFKEKVVAIQAKRLEVAIEQRDVIMRDVDLMVGALRSDFHAALRLQEAYGLRDGEWLDDPVAGYTTGYGFGEEVREAAGIRLQVTVSLDLSNSMIHNHIAENAAIAFRDIFLIMKQIQCEEGNDTVFVAAFVFSGGNDGKSASRFDERSWKGMDGARLPHGMDEFNPLARNFYADGVFSGEDTWIYPLFEAVSEWEVRESDPGAVRLDIIITDAVLEHPTDIRRSGEIQERRDGALHTVLLNLLPQDQWVNSTLPYRCVQYPANSANLMGMLRNVLAEFVGIW